MECDISMSLPDPPRERAAQRYKQPGRNPVRARAFLLAAACAGVGGAALWLDAAASARYLAVVLGYFAANFFIVSWMFEFGSQYPLFRKADGWAAWGSVIAFAPYRLLATLWVRAKRREDEAASHIVDAIWLGDREAAQVEGPWGAVLDLSFEYASPSRPGTRYLCLPTLDAIRLPANTLDHAYHWIEDQVDRGQQNTVLVHCALGRWRSAQVVVHWLMRRHGMPEGQAWEHVARRRAVVSVPPWVDADCSCHPTRSGE